MEHFDCGNCGNKEAYRHIYGAFGERCEKCADMQPTFTPNLHSRGQNKTNKKMSYATERYIKSRYIAPDGMVKCDPRFKPSEHLF